MEGNPNGVFRGETRLKVELVVTARDVGVAGGLRGRCVRYHIEVGTWVGTGNRNVEVAGGALPCTADIEVALVLVGFGIHLAAATATVTDSR